ncbi:hypothetical protein DFH29DRAFT_1067231 [Suillus ampliporus]|nr:hypothetical protein DFH29DRAFT_1067231 [Suillus ampliporus]
MIDVRRNHRKCQWIIPSETQLSVGTTEIMLLRCPFLSHCARLIVSVSCVDGINAIIEILPRAIGYLMLFFWDQPASGWNKTILIFQGVLLAFCLRAFYLILGMQEKHRRTQNPRHYRYFRVCSSIPPMLLYHICSQSP